MSEHRRVGPSDILLLSGLTPATTLSKVTEVTTRGSFAKTVSGKLHNHLSTCGVYFR